MYHHQDSSVLISLSSSLGILTTEVMLVIMRMCSFPPLLMMDVYPDVKEEFSSFCDPWRTTYKISFIHWKP